MKIEVEGKTAGALKVVRIQRERGSSVAGVKPVSSHPGDAAKRGIDCRQVIEPDIVNARAGRIGKRDIAIRSELRHVAMDLLDNGEESIVAVDGDLHRNDLHDQSDNIFERRRAPIVKRYADRQPTFS